MIWFLLTLLSAFMLATSDALTKRYFPATEMRAAIASRFVLSAVWFLPWVPWAKLSSLPAGLWGCLALLIPLDLIAFWLYVRAITTAPLSRTLPYLSLSPVFTLLAGHWLLGEAVSLHGAAGVGLIALGAWCLNLGTVKGWRGLIAPLWAVLEEPGARLMVLAALVFSVTAAIGKAALQYLPGLEFCALYAVVLGLVTGLGMRVRGNYVWRASPARPWAALALSLTMAVMVASHFIAIEHVPVAYMVAIKRTSLLFGLLYGLLWFREPAFLRSLLAALVMLAGVTLISWPV
ncbi:MAG: DMT family transporter [Gammaproteobacteria bacterium]|nr:DMT family transporter [Gammaproteobacteria bacterium]